MNDAIAGPGHNAPPGLTQPTELAEQLQSLYADLFAKIDRILARADAVPAEIADDATEEKITDFAAKQIGGLVEDCKTFHKKEKAPYWDGGKIVDGTFNPRREKLEALKALCERRVTQYKLAKEERERKKREAEAEVARKAAEATQSEAAQQYAEQAEKAADLSRARTVHGSTSSLRRIWKYSIVDPRIVPREYLTVDPKAIEAAMKRAGENMPTLRVRGVEFFEEAKTSFRG